MLYLIFYPVLFRKGLIKYEGHRCDHSKAGAKKEVFFCDVLSSPTLYQVGSSAGKIAGPHLGQAVSLKPKQTALHPFKLTPFRSTQLGNLLVQPKFQMFSFKY